MVFFIMECVLATSDPLIFKVVGWKTFNALEHWLQMQKWRYTLHAQGGLFHHRVWFIRLADVTACELQFFQLSWCH